ncbi:MAG: hypothetical protein ACYC9Z_13915 [Casimicrobiaceae bacterium]
MFGRMQQVVTRSLPARGSSRLALCAALAGTLVASAGMAVADDGPATPHPAPALAAPHPAPARSREGGLERRVKALATALDLDARQQAELRKILLLQQSAVRKIWSDGALTAAEKVPATRAVEDRSADQIRAILNEDQKRRYNPPRPQGAQSPPPDVGAWMDSAQKR